MKQHITIKQLNELSDKQIEEYLIWYRPLGTILFNWSNGNEYPAPEAAIAVGTTIGRMIEFLDEYSSDFEMIKKDEDKWAVDWYWDIDSQEYYNVKKCSELCDALWEAVKEVEHE